MSMTSIVDYLRTNFDPAISWKKLEGIRDFWKGKLVLKGVLGPEALKRRGVMPQSWDTTSPW
jgi:L-lactate dehydrogenase (cytochrome)